MAVKLIPIKCPECNAVLDLEEGRKQLFCSYCGTKILIDNSNEYIIRHIDEAKIKQSDANVLLRLKELEYKEKENARRRRGHIVAYVIGGLLFIIGSVIEFLDNYNLYGIFAIEMGLIIAMSSHISQDANKK